MNTCNIYFDAQYAYIVGNAETTHGFNIATEPMVKLARAAPPATLGAAVYNALCMYKKGVPVPKDLASLDRIFLKFTGYKSLESFEKEARCVLVELEGQNVRATPTVVGTEGGYLYRPELAIVTDRQPENIAKVILHALTLSRSKTHEEH